MACGGSLSSLLAIVTQPSGASRSGTEHTPCFGDEHGTRTSEPQGFARRMTTDVTEIAPR